MTLKQGLKHIMDNYLIAVDIETTGLNTDTDNIIEIAAIKFLNGEYVDKYVSYVNPMRKITEEITALTGITDNDVIFSPTISQIVEEVNQYNNEYKVDVCFLAETMKEEVKLDGFR